MNPPKYACITLDLEPDYAGQIPPTHKLWSPAHINQLLHFLKTHHLPLTCFVVGASIAGHSSTLQALQKYGAEFHLHSFTHDLNQPDSLREITLGKKAFRQYFRTQPQGYRAPEGRISRAGLQRVSKLGFIFEASESPTYWPFVKNIFTTPQIMYQPIQQLWEIPFSVIGPLRLLFTLSWVKLIGWPIYRFFLTHTKLPHILIFNFHLHDLWRSPSFTKLSPFWKFIYSCHHQHSFAYFRNVIIFLQSSGYQFTTITQLIPHSS